MKRTGECSVCGACCKMLIVPMKVRGGHVQGGRLWVRAGNAHAEQMPFYRARGAIEKAGWLGFPLDGDSKKAAQMGWLLGGPAVRIDSACPQLVDNRCLLHDTPEFPVDCAAWPTEKRQWDFVRDVCSFGWEGEGED
jgi:hypothetical protein